MHSSVFRSISKLLRGKVINSSIFYLSFHFFLLVERNTVWQDVSHRDQPFRPTLQPTSLGEINPVGFFSDHSVAHFLDEELKIEKKSAEVKISWRWAATFRFCVRLLSELWWSSSTFNGYACQFFPDAATCKSRSLHVFYFIVVQSFNCWFINCVWSMVWS